MTVPFLGILLTTLKVVGPPLAAILVLIASILGLKALRRQRRRTRGTPAQRVSAGWRELVDLATDLGARRPEPDTRQAVMRALQRPDLHPLAAAADALSFGPAVPDESVAAAYWRDVDVFRAASVRRLDWKRRIAAEVNLASLRGPRLLRSPA